MKETENEKIARERGEKVKKKKRECWGWGRVNEKNRTRKKERMKNAKT